MFGAFTVGALTPGSPVLLSSIVDPGGLLLSATVLANDARTTVVNAIDGTTLLENEGSETILRIS